MVVQIGTKNGDNGGPHSDAARPVAAGRVLPRRRPHVGKADVALEVTATGLFVEQFQKYNVISNGNGGTVVFFQNELPYDAPSQAAWSRVGVLG